MSDKEAEIAVLNERIRQLTEKLEEMRADVSVMKLMSERYRGGIMVVAAIGGLIGVAVQIWNNIQWHPLPHG